MEECLHSEFLHSLFDFFGFGSFLQKSPFSFIYNFVFNLFNSFSKRTVQNPNTSDVGKHQKTQIQMILRNSNYLAILHKKTGDSNHEWQTERVYS